MEDDAANMTEDRSTDSSSSAQRDDSRRSFLSKTVKRAAYIAPIVWSISAQQALAGSEDSSMFGTGGGGGPPTPE